ncbi:2-dehydropantoate 2-reductase [Rhodobacter sp. NTK016B]|uniref:ketopantoate reductase family protein n=1 Tax=Rhodobacter sp. NTK016B TaxID=2759676 RepID=UPI001A90045C|nr:2-dehydropantoate 2-reductase [Rhodobacter sp. NTK016B]MBN8294693.1 2-dehydropantoate 2-reductase [Rhodobacter sp. NTK016B]
MTIAVFGAGAVGCYFGALLAQAGEDVVLIGRQTLVDAMSFRGLQLEKDGRIEQVAVRASTDPAAIAGADLVLVCVKSPDTQAAAQAMKPHLSADATVLSLQNGIGNADLLSAELDRKVIPAVVYVAVGMAGPGHVQHKGRGELVLGEGPGTDAAATRLSAAKIPTEVSDQAETALWTKLTLNCAVNAISALTRQPYGVIARRPEAEATFATLVAECRAVAQASGIALPDDMLNQVMGITRSMAGQLSSTAQDVIAGKPTEIAMLNGEIARRGAALGIDTPLNRALAMMVGLIEPR